MIYSSEQYLIETRKALLWKLLNDNQYLKQDLIEACAIGRRMIQYLDSELHKLESKDLNENLAGAVPILKHLKLLTNRFLIDIRMWTQNFLNDAKWLNDNLYKCDPIHTDIWCKMMTQSKDYSNLLNLMHARFLGVHKMIIEIALLL
ncbi:unnamed protein product [Larinioides sclopetarius]|uniref:Uncharacterized protein n=1 Tax=Larinioides sclopetarius TaxID=280406 RepID=A0AAV1ZNI9_9ARAC